MTGLNCHVAEPCTGMDICYEHVCMAGYTRQRLGTRAARRVAAVSGQFADALSARADAARDAFDRCNRRAGLVPYDRTAFGRWLKGDLPSRREFVLALAEELGDQSVYDAWLLDRGDTADAAVKRVVSSFIGLSEHSQTEAVRQIEDYLAVRQGSIRDRFRMEVEIDDWPDDDRLLRASVTISWLGSLPADAKVVLLGDYSGLADAYEQPDCLFRDALATPGDQSAEELLARCAAEISYFDEGGEADTPVTRYGTSLTPGEFSFVNDRLRKADIVLQVTYPYPRFHGRFPILFRGYQIRGRARIIFRPRSARIHSPGSYAFLGLRDAFRSVTTPRSDVSVIAGREGEFLREGTGLVFTWSETPD